ncbi:helix-turn-helix transcriptional regulator [Cohnella rhizosphaerae]|uniref:WYL domain-containing protein n=1 Tax=Cohnella rhizosphaerae TaxID=1457232 RepID=A0A9X4KR19_9BACL|nr:WYL domain-containing protein [Cohnella rhizosphaerae]MDG0808958.1 WYL domain-containing protein [Cohnella rhizosphaerae]
MRADRLLDILQCLQTQRLVNARELAAKLEISERTVHRDMEALARAGFPVYAERGPRGGWMLPEGYRTRLTGLTSDEIAGLTVLQSSSAVSDLNLSGPTGNAIAKLAAALAGPARDEAAYVRKHLHIDGAGWHDAREPAPYLGLVQQAVWEQRKMRIRYPSGEMADGAVSVVMPWGLVAKRHTWYFAAVKDHREPGGMPAAGSAAARDHADQCGAVRGDVVGSDVVRGDVVRGDVVGSDVVGSDVVRGDVVGSGNAAAAGADSDAKGKDAASDAANRDPEGRAASALPEPRTYRVSRLAAVELLEERFEVPDDFDLASWWERSVARFRRELPVYPVRLLVREEAWARFSREMYVRVRSCADAADGWKATDADFHTPDSALGILLGYGASIRVLSPRALARSVFSEAKALLALYEGPDSAPQDQGQI